MKVNRLLLSVLVSSVFLSAGANAADTGMIEFTGSITDTTCNVVVNGGSSADGTVTLPSVSASSLAAADATNGRTSFTLNLSGCSAATSELLATSTAKAFFQSGTTVDATTGRLINTAADDVAAGSVSLQLLDATNSYSVIRVGDSSQATGTAGYVSLSGSDTNTIVLPYAVEYYAEGATTAGSVTSKVNYNITYQ